MPLAGTVALGGRLNAATPAGRVPASVRVCQPEWVSLGFQVHIVLMISQRQAADLLQAALTSGQVVLRPEG